MLAAVISAIALLAPTEATMGNVQRILYIHVPAAWLSLLGLLVMAGSGVLYLRTRNQSWDQWSQAAAELGWLCCGLTLATGSLWAHAAWGTWWTWDPAAHLDLHPVDDLSGYLILRRSWTTPSTGSAAARSSQSIGTLDVPLVIVAAHGSAASIRPPWRWSRRCGWHSGECRRLYGVVQRAAGMATDPIAAAINLRIPRRADCFVRLH